MPRLSLVLSLWLLGAAVATPATAGEPLKLSPELRALLQGEMRGISAAMQAAMVAVATGEWPQAEAAAIGIRDAYLGHKDFPQPQREEMQRVLPAGFRALDAGFHERAGKLARAAAARDGELAAVHLGRLVESCIACHSQYVGYRFAGFAGFPPAAPDADHGHEGGHEAQHGHEPH
jgi:hypothetical protein